MPLDADLLYAFLLVFVRCSAMLLSSPMFGAQNTPLPVRIFTTLSIAGALTLVVKPHVAAPPEDLYTFVFAVANEALAGLLLGAFFSMVLHAATIAGAFLDIQMGLGLSQALNPITGVPVSVIGQFKYLLCLIVFLQLNAHHFMIEAFTESYRLLPSLKMEMLPQIQTSLLEILGQMCLLALRIAAPVAAVSVVVDAALGAVNKAVPQMQAMLVGLPAKILLGMVALSVALPALTSSVQYGVEYSVESLTNLFLEVRG